MNLETLLNQLPEYAKDNKINLQNLINQQNPILTSSQIFGCLLATAFATKNKKLIDCINNEVQNKFSELDIRAVKIACSLMAMNNVYYRFTHLSEDKEYSQMQAGLRMRMLLEHNIAKVDFEIFSLAVSVINGCGTCIDAHANQLLQHSLNKSQVQMVAKIASVINAIAQILTIEQME